MHALRSSAGAAANADPAASQRSSASKSRGAAGGSAFSPVALGAGRASLSGDLALSFAALGGGGAAADKRRTTASPGAIAFLASMLNASGGSEAADLKSAARASDTCGNENAGSAAAAAAMKPLDEGSPASQDEPRFERSLGPAAPQAEASRRQSLLSPGMAALFGLGPPHDDETAGASAASFAAPVAADNVPGNGSQARSATKIALSSSSSSLRGGPAAEVNANNNASTSFRTGPAHRVKTPGRSCMTAGKGTATAGYASRRAVIFGSPQAAEYAMDAAVAESITALEKSAAKARYKLGSEPELPFPSLADSEMASMPATSAVAAAAGAGRDDDGSSIESLETSSNSAQLREWDDDVSRLEPTSSRNKRAREAARARARLSALDASIADPVRHASGDGLPGVAAAVAAASHDVAALEPLPAPALPPASPSASAAAAGIASPLSKRSRRSSEMSRRTAAMDAAAAASLSSGEAEADGDAEASHAGGRSMDLTTLGALALPPPTPLRRSRRVAGIDGASAVAAEASTSSAIPRSAGHMNLTSLRGSDPAGDVAGAEPSPISGPPPALLASLINNPSTCGAVASAVAAPEGPSSLGGPDLAGMASSRGAPAGASVSPGPVLSRRVARAGGAGVPKRRVTLAIVSGTGRGAAATEPAEPPLRPLVARSAAAPAMPQLARRTSNESVASADRTADTAQRDALFALLADDNTPLPAAEIELGACIRHGSSSSSKRTGGTAGAASPSDFTAMLDGARGMAFPTAQAQARAQPRSQRPGGFGLAAMLHEPIRASAALEHTAALPTSLGSLLASEDQARAQQGPSSGLRPRRPAAQGHASFGDVTAAIPVSLRALVATYEDVDRVVDAGAEASFDLAAGLGAGNAVGEDDNTYASIDAVPRADGNGSFAPGSPELSFNAAAAIALGTASTSLSESAQVRTRSSARRTRQAPALGSAGHAVHVSRHEEASIAMDLGESSRHVRGDAIAPFASRALPPPPPSPPQTELRAATAVAIAPAVSPSVTRGMPVPASALPSSNMMASALVALFKPTTPCAAAATAPAAVAASSANKARGGGLVSAPDVAPAFGFEEFCAVAGLRVLWGGSRASGALAAESHTGAAAAALPQAAGAASKKDRRRSSIAIMARKSMAGMGAGAAGRRRSATGPAADEAAVAAALVTRHVLIPEREQIVGATDVLRREISAIAPVLATYVRELDASPPSALREVARAQALLSAFDLEGTAAAGYNAQALAKAEPLLARLRDLRATHELNASLVYLQWRADMAQQRLGSLRMARATLTSELAELRAADERLASADEAVGEARRELDARGSAALAAAAGPLQATCAAAAAARVRLAALCPKAATAEASLATLAARRSALQESVATEALAVAELDAEAAAYGSSSTGGGAAAAERSLAAGTAAARRYDELCSQTGWRIAGVALGPSPADDPASVTLAFAHPDGSSHELVLQLLAPAPAENGPSFVTINFVGPALGDVAAAAVAEAWRPGSVLEHYRAASSGLVEAFRAVAAAGAAGPLLRARIAELGTSIRRVGAMCAEVVALRELLPCRFARGGDAAALWVFAADLSAPAKRLKLRLQLDLEAAARAAYPSRPFACTLTWVSGEQRGASGAVARAVQAAQAAFLAGPHAQPGAAPGAGGALRSLVRAADKALKAL